jgi:hypothetical protein
VGEIKFGLSLLAPADSSRDQIGYGAIGQRVLARTARRAGPPSARAMLQLGAQEQIQLLPRLGGLGLDPHGRARGARGFVDPSLQSQRHRQIAVGLGVLRVDVNRPAQMHDRFVELFPRTDEQRQVAMRVGVFRVDLHR